MPSNDTLEQNREMFNRLREYIDANDIRVLILRGPQGVGKTTFTALLKSYYHSIRSARSIMRVSADDWMVDIYGNYKFNAEMLPEVHRHCFAECVRWFEYATDHPVDYLCVVDNTNIHPVEYGKYWAVADLHNVNSVILDFHLCDFTHHNYASRRNPVEYNTQRLVERNVHGVGLSGIQKAVQGSTDRTLQPPLYINKITMFSSDVSPVMFRLG